MAAPKLDLEKLRQAITARPRPSEAEGRNRQQEYGTSYKSPYSKRVSIMKRPSAPSVLVSLPPPPPKPQAPAVSHYNQAEMNKNRKSILANTKDKDKDHRQSHQPPKKHSTGVSGYFSPLMNAPSNLVQHGSPGAPSTKVGRKKQRLYSLQPPPSPESPNQLPTPLIPPKPAKTENLPQLPIALFFKQREENSHRSSEPQDKDKTTNSDHSRGGRKASVSFKGHQTSEKQKRVSLMLDPTRRRSLRDGSIDLELDQIATADIAIRKDYEDEFDEDSEAGYFGRENYFHLQLAQQDKDDSLIMIRPHLSKDLKEYTEEWKKHRFSFMTVFVYHMILTFILIGLAHVFIFYYNYGLDHLPDSLLKSNETLYHHEHRRHLLNVHMYITFVLSMQFSQFWALLYRLFPSVPRTKMKWIHGPLQLSAAACRVAGVLYCVEYHDVSGHPDLLSMHSYIGMLGTILNFISVITGITFILPCCSWETRVTLTPVHRYNANLLIIADAATVITGLVTMSIKYFDWENFPDFYPDPYYKITGKSIVLNLMAVLVVLLGGSTMYLEANHRFRREGKPGNEKFVKDLDLEAIHRVAERRQHKALALEATEQGKGDMEACQIGSRKSFNLAGKQKYWHLIHSKGDKSIPALINEAEKQKSNFTDTDLLLALE